MKIQNVTPQNYDANSLNKRCAVSNPNTPSFGIKLDGDIALKIHKELLRRGKACEIFKYENQYNALRKIGHEASEIYISDQGDSAYFILKNPKLSTEYEIPIVKAAKNKLFEAFLELTPPKIIGAEKDIQSMATRNLNGVRDAAKRNVKAFFEVMNAGKGRDLDESLKNIDDNKMAELYFAYRNVK